MGDGIEVDFTSGSPVYNNTGIAYGNYATSVMADAVGNVLFYTNGEKIFQPDHVEMLNGSLTLGATGVGTTTINKPGSANEYYIFYRNSNGRLAYAEVDMTGNGGNGEVINQGTVLSDNSIIEGIQAVTHCEGENIWLVAHEANNQTFLSFLVTPNGVSQNPVTSVVPNDGNIGFHFSSGLIFDPNFTRLASITQAGDQDTYHIEVCDFDRSTGELTTFFAQTTYNSIFIFRPQSQFSVDGLTLYHTAAISLSKIDLTTGIETTIAPGIEAGAMTIGKDGKIYASSGSDIPHLYQFDNPNSQNDINQFPVDADSYYGVCNYYQPLEPIECVNTAPLSVSSSVTQPLCDGELGSISINVSGGTPPYTYNWSPSNLSGTDVQNLAPGQYAVTIIDAINTAITADFEINEGNTLDATIATTDATDGQANGSAIINVTSGMPSYEINWFTTPPQTGTEAVNLLPGDYQVEVIDGDSCVFTYDFQIDNTTNTFAINDTDAFNITPTLTSNMVTISSAYLSEPKNWTIYSINGQIISEGYWNDAAVNIDFASFPKGIYVIRIQHLQNNFIGKVTKI